LHLNLRSVTYLSKRTLSPKNKEHTTQSVTSKTPDGQVTTEQTLEKTL